MTRLPFDEHLTHTDPKLAKQVKRTHAGMAHWAGSGPKGKTCRECVHWEFDGWLITTAQLKAATCARFTAMMNGAIGGRIPHAAHACKYFEADPMPADVYDPKAR